VTYDSDIAAMARATAALVVTGDGALQLRGAEPPAAMACRDALVTALRGGLEGLASTWIHDGSAGQRQVARDLKELTDALRDLTAASPGGMSLGPALAVRGGPLTVAWQGTAREAAALEIHRGRILRSQIPAAARDLAELAVTLPLLDGDLAAALPTPPQALTDAAAPARVALAAEGLRQIHGQEPAPTSSAQAAPRAIPLVRSFSDLPGATRHLAGLVEWRGSELTAAEVRAARAPARRRTRAQSPSARPDDRRGGGPRAQGADAWPDGDADAPLGGCARARLSKPTSVRQRAGTSQRLFAAELQRHRGAAGRRCRVAAERGRVD